MADLITAFRQADFFSARDEYMAIVTDLPSYVLTLKLGDRTKIVTDYAGPEVGMPDAVRDLERLIDETADTAQWVSVIKH